MGVKTGGTDAIPVLNWSSIAGRILDWCLQHVLSVRVHFSPSLLVCVGFVCALNLASK